ncbi:hypothetical protein F2Q68_00012051 [Brassica cretica]|uniref:Uncharacterized protein n=1 Tax=Brassica cretica TaxID=69181 RepID=A0A8S9KSB2_BRACR|nr:hypothetical protein F2Q68_00012051 [Brassica cretica]
MVERRVISSIMWPPIGWLDVMMMYNVAVPIKRGLPACCRWYMAVSFLFVFKTTQRRFLSNVNTKQRGDED